MHYLNRYLVVCFGAVIAFTLSACSPQTWQFLGSNDNLRTQQAGVREGGVIKASGQPGFLVYGPYLPLEPGIYRLIAKGSLSGQSKAMGVIDVTAEAGNRILASKPIVAGQSDVGDIVSLAFEVTQPIVGVEFRINVGPQCTGSFTAYELTKVAKLEHK